MSKPKPTNAPTPEAPPLKIGGFQVSSVTEVPQVARSTRGIYAELIDAVPDLPEALRIDFGDAKLASTKAAGVRGYMQRNNLKDEFTVVRQGALLFIAKADAQAGGKPKASKPEQK